MALPHGGNICHFAHKYGIPEEDFLDFSASVNPLGPPKTAMTALLGALPSLVNYPDPACGSLMDALSAHHGVGPESFLAGNGSTELIYLIPRVLRPKKGVVLAPTFSDYERALRLAGCEVARFPLRENDGFAPDVAGLIGKIKGADILFLCNPNNPTGTLIGKDDLLGLIRRARRAGVFVVVDEAFIEYVPGGSIIKEAAATGGVAVLRNFTKFYAMPGLRAGYVCGHPGFIRRLRAGQEPWSMNTLAQSAAAAALGDAEYSEKSMRLFKRESKFLSRGMGRIEGLRPYPSSANFLLVEIRGSADALAERLAAKGILIRSCSNFKGLGDRFIRVAVKTRAENAALLDNLR